MLNFIPEQTNCPIDGQKLKVLKTGRRTIKSLGLGTLQAYYKIFYCKDHPELGCFRSAALDELAAPNTNAAYDVIVEIGRLRFFENRRVREIQSILLEKHSLVFSNRGIELLIDKFVFYLAAVHQESRKLINEQIKAQGGYILHLDSTCEGDSPKLTTSIDSVSSYVLYSSKLKSENTNEVVVFLNELKNRFGRPLAVVSDMSKGIEAAVKQVFNNMNHYICHYHFLAAIGKLLFEQEHIALRKALSKAGISGKLKAERLKMKKNFVLSVDDIENYLTDPQQLGKTREAARMFSYYLILWVLDHSSDGNGYGFPFDQRYLNFYDRIKAAQVLINQVKGLYSAQAKNDAVIWKLYHLFENILGDSALKAIVTSYKTKLSVFSDLRRALDIASEPAQNGLTQTDKILSAQEFEKIKTAVGNFMEKIDLKISNVNDPKIRTNFRHVKERIEKYWHRLFADPLIIKVNSKEKMIFVQRTNNILENHFRRFNYFYRQIHGNRSVRRNLENVPEELPLVENLKNQNYIKLVFQNESNIAKRFSQIDAKIIRQMAAEHRTKKYMQCSRKIKRILREDNFKQRLRVAFAAVAA